MIVFARSQDGRRAILVEINSETDFVARDASFTQFASDVAETALGANVVDVTVLAQTKIASQDMTVEEARQALVAKIW